MPEQFGEKTHEATQHRREKAREEGHVTRSQDLAAAALLCASSLVLLYWGQNLVDFLGRLTSTQLAQNAPIVLDATATTALIRQLTTELAGVLLPILGMFLLAAVLVNVGQVGFLFLPQKLAWDVSRIDPLKGWQRVFSLANVVRLGFGLVKVAIVVVVAVWSLWGEWGTVLSANEREARQIAPWLFQLILWTTFRISLALLVLAILDYGYQWYRYEQDLRMTTQEMREEMRNLQGDPQIIARRRMVQRQLVLNRMSSAVPKADVIVTNPTELAIAIQYDPETMDVPMVVAKGAGLIAERIRRLALENGIPIVERKELARFLYKSVDIGKPIPAEQYAAMAEVLRYVYQLQGKTLPTLKKGA